MSRMKRLLITLGIVAVLSALVIADRSFTQTQNRKSNEPAQSQTERPDTAQKAASDKDVVIGYLKGRDNIVTISRGPEGIVYTVKNKDGKILDAKLGEKELQTKYPSLYDQVKYGMAGNDATLRKTAVKEDGRARSIINGMAR